MPNKMVIFKELYIIFILFLVAWISVANRVEPACPKSARICEFDLEISESVTMIHIEESGANHVLEYGKDGKLYSMKAGCAFKQEMKNIDMSKVPIGDGSQKRVLLYNNQLPGPPVVVYEGQQVVVRVWNRLTDMGTTVHFHGCKQQDTPWMDGVSGVSQCDILPGEHFTYRFLASPVGTHWYHSHYGTQRSLGAAGAFIVLERDEDKAGRIETSSPLPKFDEDFYMVAQDWYRENTEDISMLIAYDPISFPFNYDPNTCYNSTKQADGVDSGVIPFVSALINGRGRYSGHDVRYPKQSFVPYEIYPVRVGGFYRFRIIGASMLFPLRVSVDHHPIHVFASDGNHLKTQAMDSLIVFNGERYDFYVEATDPLNVGNYWIRIQTLEVIQSGQRVEPGHVEAILRYDGAAEVDPTTSPRTCTKDNPCHSYNCPFSSEVTGVDNIMCHPLTDLSLLTPEPILVPEEGDDIVEYFLNFHFAFNTRDSNQKPTINGIQHVNAVASPMTYPDVANSTQKHCFFNSCPKGLCRSCQHQLHLPLNKIIQFNLVVTVTNEPGVINGNDHPIHIHGHTVQVLKISYPYYHPETRFYNKTSTHFKCTADDCNNIEWTNSSWEGGNIPGLLKHSAPRKDSFIVPVGGYTIVRFKTDNPGYWIMHCHVEFHNAEGMALVIKSGQEAEMNAKPQSMRTCGNFRWQDENDSHVHLMDEDEQTRTDLCQEADQVYKIPVFVLGAAAIFLFTSNVYMACSHKIDEDRSHMQCH